MKKIAFLSFFLLAAAGNTFAQVSATLEGYPLSTTGWTVGGDAAVVDSEVELTGPSETQSGYVYYSTPVNLTTCSQFTVEFDFQIVQSGTTTIADGIAFWYISNPPSGFATGGGIGLPLNPNGLLTILDSYNNNGLPDDNPLETLLYYNGTVPAYVEGSATGLLCPVVTYQYFITDGSWHHCKMTYNAGNINVYFNYSTVASLSAFRLISITGYFGFSSSTGLYYSTQSIKNVTINSVGVLAAPTVSSPVTYCQYAPAATLTATGTPLAWYATDTAMVDSLPSAPTPNTAVTGTTTYYVRQGYGTCQSPPDSIEVIVSPQPAPPVITGDTVYCSGEAFVPFSVTGTNILWYASATGGTGSTTAPAVNTAVPGTYSFYASQSNSGCESARDSIKVVVRTTPSAPLLTAGDSVYCQFATFLPFSVTGDNLLWYTTASGGTGNIAAPAVNTSVIANNSYYVSQTDSGCESPRLHITADVNAKPVAPTVAPPVYCQFDVSVPLTAIGSNLLWYGSSIPVTGTAIGPVPSTTVPAADSYYVTQTILGCMSDSTLDIILIKPKPAPPVTADSSYCQFAEAPSLTATGSDLQWYITPSGGSPLAMAPTPSTSVPGSTTWYVSQLLNGCESDRSPLSVNVYHLPQFVITPSSPFVCQYDSINLAYNGQYLYAPEYSWVLPQGATVVDGTSLTGMPSIVVQFDSINQSNYVYLTAKDDSGKCSTTDTILIVVEGKPAANAFTNPEVCIGDTTALSLSYRSSDAAEFIWKIDNQLLNFSDKINIIYSNSNSAGPYGIAWNDTGIHIIQLNSFTQQGCASSPSYDTVDVHSLPDASFIYKTKDHSLCIEDSLLFIANSTDHSYLYAWSPAHSFDNINAPSTWGKVEGDPSIISLTVTNAFGCSAASTQTLEPGTCCTVGFPNAFTPNGDGLNDIFRPIFPDTSYHTFHEFRIANRWGQTIFESANSSPAWNGTFNGIPQDMGVYYYYIKFDCSGNTVEQKGDVTLVR